MKKCTKCGIEKEENNENFRKKNATRYETQCKTCINARRRAMRNGTAENIGGIKRTRKPDEYYKEAAKKRREKNKEREKEVRRKWREKNKEKIRKKSAEYYQKHRLHLQEWMKNWCKENRKKVTAYHREQKIRNPFKHKARRYLQYYIEKVRIVRPTHCENCNKECKVDAHHKDYGKPLEVNWFCRQCHAKEHGRLKET